MGAVLAVAGATLVLFFYMVVGVTSGEGAWGRSGLGTLQGSPQTVLVPAAFLSLMAPLMVGGTSLVDFRRRRRAERYRDDGGAMELGKADTEVQRRVASSATVATILGALTLLVLLPAAVNRGAKLGELVAPLRADRVVVMSYGINGGVDIQGEMNLHAIAERVAAQVRTMLLLLV